MVPRIRFGVWSWELRVSGYGFLGIVEFGVLISLTVRKISLVVNRDNKITLSFFNRSNNLFCRWPGYSRNSH